jgi:crotonobetainyl-CoA:carnitine CoA-transferase CaiB-like acyl-CoA transferase
VNCGNDAQFARLSATLNMPEIANDKRFQTNEARCKNRILTDQLLSDALASWKKDDIINKLESVNVPCGPINNIPSLFSDPQLKARELEVELPRNDGAVFKGVAFPPKFSKTPARYENPPPQLGADNQQVFNDWKIE